jgi:hypothetical protein
LPAIPTSITPSISRVYISNTKLFKLPVNNDLPAHPYPVMGDFLVN